MPNPCPRTFSSLQVSNFVNRRVRRCPLLQRQQQLVRSMLEDALAAAAQERDAVASAFAERRALLRSLRMLRRCTPSLHKLTDKQQRGVLGVQRRRSHRLASEGAAPAHV